MAETVLIFLAGVAGSMHCLGMCSGFACGLGTDARGAAATVRRHLLYNLGRVVTYCFFGATIGHLGLQIVGHAGEYTTVGIAQRALALVSGLLMLLVGAQFLGYAVHARRPGVGAGAAWLTGSLRTLVRAPGAGAPLALGVANGFLPCPLVYAFAAQAAASGGALPGLLTMAAFGLGTFPMMLIAGMLGTHFGRSPSGAARAQPVLWHSQRAASRSPGVARLPVGVRIAGAFIIALGLLTLARGVLPMGPHLHGA